MIQYFTRLTSLIFMKSKKTKAGRKQGDFLLFVDDDLLDKQIKYVYAVRRPLDTPGTRHKLGVVLSHSGCICITESGENILVEYMFGSRVHVHNCVSYEEGKNFVFQNLTFVHETETRQSPSEPVTIRQFAQTMADFMRGKSFATYTHNCHQARYVTMNKYGMKSKNPDSFRRNVFFQGLIDYFKARRV